MKRYKYSNIKFWKNSAAILEYRVISLITSAVNAVKIGDKSTAAVIVLIYSKNIPVSL